MSQPVGLLTIRIWHDESGVIRARVLAQLDIAAVGDPEFRPCRTTDEIDAIVRDWIRRYRAL